MFSHHKLVHTPPLSHMCYMLCPSHSSRFHNPHNGGWGVQIMKFLIIKFSTWPNMNLASFFVSAGTINIWTFLAVVVHRSSNSSQKSQCFNP
jgi:hypothetical protein